MSPIDSIWFDYQWRGLSRLDAAEALRAHGLTLAAANALLDSPIRPSRRAPALVGGVR
jgi:hypothetical protein